MDLDISPPTSDIALVACTSILALHVTFEEQTVTLKSRLSAIVLQVVLLHQLTLLFKWFWCLLKGEIFSLRARGPTVVPQKGGLPGSTQALGESGTPSRVSDLSQRKVEEVFSPLMKLTPLLKERHY